jgi:predicted Fe-Mo cluster-binding NifX family protein
MAPGLVYDRQRPPAAAGDYSSCGGYRDSGTGYTGTRTGHLRQRPWRHPLGMRQRLWGWHAGRKKIRWMPLESLTMEEQKRPIHRIAIAADGSGVSSHFGHCEKFAIYHIRSNEIIHQESIISPGHEPGKLPRLLSSCGVTHVLAGGMGMKAVRLFEEQGIGVILGIQGSIDEVATCFAQDRIVAGRSMCNHAQCGHETEYTFL